MKMYEDEDEDGDEEDEDEDGDLWRKECSKQFLEKAKGCSVVRSLCTLCKWKGHDGEQFSYDGNWFFR
jgi:hypothetical protein